MAKLWSICMTKRKKDGTICNNIEDYTIGDYRNMAKRFISKYTSRALSAKMLADEDAISFVVENLMYATQRWNEDKGQSFSTYLIQCARWSIPRWVKIMNRENKQYSLDFSINEEDDDSYEIIADKKQKTPIEKLIKKENISLLKKIIKESSLTNTQKLYLKSIYFDGLTGSETAREYEVSRQAVNQSIKQSIKILQNHCKENNIYI